MCALHTLGVYVLVVCVCYCFLPRPDSSLHPPIVPSVVLSGFGHLAAIEDNAETVKVGQ